MAPSQTEIESRVIELAEKSFKTFCGDISGMFGVDMVCSQQQVGPETVNGLKRRFKKFVVVYLVKAEGELDGTFQLLFDSQGLFILAGVVAMHPEHMILENVKSASLEKAGQLGNILTEVGDALVGAWDRVFQKALDGHGRFVQANTFIGSPWDDSKKKIGLAGNEKLMFVPIEMTVGSYPAFNCGIIFPKAILTGKSESESEAPNVSEGVEKSKPQEPTDEKAAAKKTRAEENTKEATEAGGKAVAEKAKPEAEEAVAADKSAAEQEPEAPEEQKPEAAAEGQPEVATEGEPEAAAEEECPVVAAEGELEAAAEEEHPAVAAEGELEAAAEEERPAVAAEEPKAVPEEKTEAAAEEPKAAPEEKPEAAAEEPKAVPEEKTEAAAEQKSNDVDVKAPETAETDKSEKHPISEAIQKMTRSSAVLPGEPPPSVEAEKLPLGSEDALLAVCAKDIMQKNIIWGDPEDSVQKALAKIQQRNAGYMMIGRGKIPEGVVSKSDLTGALSPYLRPTFAKWRRPMDDATLQIKVKWVMSKPTCTVTPETPLPAMIEHICKAGRLCLPVVDQQGKVQGLVTVFDIFKVLLKRSRPK